MSTCCLSSKEFSVLDRIKAVAPKEKTVKSLMELAMIATAILTLALL